MTASTTHKRRNGLLIAAGVAAFAATCVAAAPASLLPALAGADRSDVAFKDITGTIWRGEIFGLSVASAPLGDVKFRLSPFSLLTLSPTARVVMQGGAARGEADVTLSRSSVAVSGADFDVDLAPFARQGVLGQPVEGQAQIKINHVRFSRRRGCSSAAGVIWTNVLEAPARQYRMEGFPMSGDVKCAGEDLVIALSGGGDTGDAEMTIRISPDWTYELTATARPTQDDVASALRFFGFEDKNGALTYGSAGVLTGAGS